MDYACKFKQFYGQAVWYSQETGKQPVCVLIVEGPKDHKYVEHLNDMVWCGVVWCEKKDMRIFIITPKFLLETQSK